MNFIKSIASATARHRFGLICVHLCASVANSSLLNGVSRIGTRSSRTRPPCLRASVVILFFLCGLCLCADKPSAYSNDFHDAKPGPVPEEMMVLNGSFTISEQAGKKFLELAGQPIESDGLLFGPADAQGGQVSARVFASSTGRRFPEVGIGLGDVAGYKLWFEPGQSKIEIRQGDQTLASASYSSWKSGTWTSLSLRVSKNSSGILLQGKAWPADQKEPAKWTIESHAAEPLAVGHCSLWGTPYSGTAIRFDDLKYSPPQ